MTHRRKQSGFTLVEIAIVLVIIGLLLGGVLKGREMITNAKIKRIENDFAGVSAAIYAYQDRYGVLPGDDPAASSRFSGTWAAADNGNGNGNISGGWSSTNNSQESRKIWKHLRGAGLIAGPVDNTAASFQQPSNSFGGLVGIDLNLYNLSGHNIVFGELPGDIAQILEARGDDGVPSTGSIQSHGSQTTYNIDTRYDVAFRQ
ncbi:MAG: prepilin-type N-terminal cleavage/methylation domain-containing protein [Gammaproteobacteria bacterium]|nr:prepilin-type N-terminal cleavage/methylation domain-containing protein [Gammaproteobacteria bacterium]